MEGEKGWKIKRRIIGEEEERERVRGRSEKVKEVCELKKGKKKDEKQGNDGSKSRRGDSDL